DGGLVNVDDGCADDGRANDFPVKHAGYSYVVHKFESAERERGNIDARYRLAEDRPFVERLARGVRVKREAEVLASDKFTVRDFAGSIARDYDGAVARGELRRRDAEVLRGKLDERLAGGCGGLCEIRVIEIRRMRLAAGRVAFVRRAPGVSGDHRDVSERHAELFGDELRLRSDDALAKLLFAGVTGHFAVGGDGNPRVDLVGSRRTARFADAELRENRIET